METIKFLKETPLGALNIKISELKLGDRYKSDKVEIRINENDFSLDFLFDNGVKGLKIYKCDTGKVFGKKLDKNVMLTLPAEILETLECGFEELKAEKEAWRQLYIERIKSGEEMIQATWREGSPLSGFMVHDDEARQLLKNIGLTEEISGWGTIIDWQFMEKVGDKFTYLQALEYTQPKRDKVEASKKAKDEKFNKALAEAKETGKPVVIGHYTDDCNDPNEECSMDTITEYIHPDGKIRTTRQHTW